MGHRLHVAKKYKVEYALGDAFNYKVSELKNLLRVCCENEYPYTGDEFDDEFEVSKEDWQEMIDALKHVGMLSESENEEIMDAVELMGESLEELIRDLQYFLDKADPDNDYLHLSFF